VERFTPCTPRTRVRRLAKRGAYDRATIDAIHKERELGGLRVGANPGIARARD
jgi:hypothetical protein